MQSGDKVRWLHITPAVVVKVGQTLILIEVIYENRPLRFWVNPKNLKKEVKQQ